MIVREYEPKDRKGLEQCLALLQGHIADIDPLHRTRTLADFDPPGYATHTLAWVQKHDGAVFIAEENGEVIGCIAGVVHVVPADDPEEYPSIDGVITELIVHNEHRGKRVGNALMERMEEYLIAKNCSVVKADCFSPNTQAHAFYVRLGFSDRLITMTKPLKK